MALPSALLSRLADGPPLLLDGATGTELERRGVPTRLPLWSAAALDSHPEVVEAIHADYVAAGAELITANTFRTQRRSLEHAALGARAAELCARAVALARRAAGERAWVLGSAPPLEDCYRPDLVPEASALAREHAEHARALVEAGVDAILVETMNTRREAVAALEAARAAGAAALASFVCWEGARLLSGEPLSEALAAASDAGARALLVNCLPPSNAEACLDALAVAGLPFGVYCNLGEPEDTSGFRRSEDTAPAAFAALARGWLARGARLVGGCCGTTPAHLAAVAAGLPGTRPAPG